MRSASQRAAQPTSNASWIFAPLPQRQPTAELQRRSSLLSTHFRKRAGYWSGESGQPRLDESAVGPVSASARRILLRSCGRLYNPDLFLRRRDPGLVELAGNGDGSAPKPRRLLWYRRKPSSLKLLERFDSFFPNLIDHSIPTCVRLGSSAMHPQTIDLSHG